MLTVERNALKASFGNGFIWLVMFACLALSVTVTPVHAAGETAATDANLTLTEPAGTGMAVESANGSLLSVETGDSLSDGFDELDELDDLDEWSDDSSAGADVYDPIEPVNRLFFTINDKLYFWGIKPVAEGYAWLLPKVARESISRFFANVFTPIRLANCLLQLNFSGAGSELSRFAINSTIGILGFMDPAYERWKMARVYEDFGQTLGVYGVGFGPYLVIPFLGPSCPRDGVGMFVDSYFNPVNYYLTSFVSQAAIRGSWTINERSLQLGEYEALKASSLDPYVALRSAYYQFRENMVNDQPKIFGSFIAK
jgi:phospholipid-binding lipoprotein MlaA